MKRIVLVVSAAILMIVLIAAPASGADLSSKETLGKLIFFDANLSTPPGVSCATCHDPAAGFADPREGYPTSQGVVPTRFGSRNAPTISYSSYSPVFRYLPNMGPMNRGVYEGGQNWDGAAASLLEQAKLPFLNVLEMKNPTKKHVIVKVSKSDYAAQFKTVYGMDVFNDVDYAYDCVADAIVAYESSAEVNRFTSKYDYYLKGLATLTDQEARGLALFETKGGCARCHRNRPALDGTPPVFTSRHHANVGVPKNPENPFYALPFPFNPLGNEYIELGTGGVVNDPWHYGRVKIPTLRNIALTAPYSHNGVFPDLQTVVEFYDTRDVPGAGWPPPEVNSANIIRMDNLGNLGLTDQEAEDIVAYLETLTDGYQP